jgi:hypothetical protein
MNENERKDPMELLKYIEMQESLDRREQVFEKLDNRESLDFKTAAREVAQQMEGDFTGVDLREKCESLNIRPKSIYAWGSFIAGLRRSGLIEETGEWRMTKTEKRNPSRSPVYRRVR